VSGSVFAFVAFARERKDAGDSYAPWWPLWKDEWPLHSATPDEALRDLRERIEGNGEWDTWGQLAVAPFEEWTTT